jgi:hypothetical protein
MTGTLTVNGLIINHWQQAPALERLNDSPASPPGPTSWRPKVQGTPEELAAIERELTT